jgi:hypothetical protein
MGVPCEAKLSTQSNGTDRKINSGESVNIGLVMDTRDETIGTIPNVLASNINLVAEITDNAEKASFSN